MTFLCVTVCAKRFLEYQEYQLFYEIASFDILIEIVFFFFFLLFFFFDNIWRTNPFYPIDFVAGTYLVFQKIYF